MTTVVVDASVLVDALLPGPNGDAARAALDGAGEIAAPEHLRIEVLSVLRRISLREEHPALDTARRTLVELEVTLVPLVEIADRIWELRQSLTPYDAAYLAVSEQREATLITADTALLNHPGRRCPMRNPREDSR